MRCVFKVEVLHLDGWKSAEPSSLSVRESQPYGQTLWTSIALEEERDGWQSTDVQALSDQQGKHYPAMTPKAIDVAGLDVCGTPWRDAGGAPFKRQRLARQGRVMHWITKPHLAAMSTLDRKRLAWDAKASMRRFQKPDDNPLLYPIQSLALLDCLE